MHACSFYARKLQKIHSPTAPSNLNLTLLLLFLIAHAFYWINLKGAAKVTHALRTYSGEILLLIFWRRRRACPNKFLYTNRFYERGCVLSFTSANIISENGMRSNRFLLTVTSCKSPFNWRRENNDGRLLYYLWKQAGSCVGREKVAHHCDLWGLQYGLSTLLNSHLNFSKSMKSYCWKKYFISH